MKNEDLPEPDKNGIIRILPLYYNNSNKKLLKKFNINPAIYDFFQENIVRPNIHKANTTKHYEILKSQIESLTKRHLNIILTILTSVLIYVSLKEKKTKKSIEKEKMPWR